MKAVEIKTKISTDQRWLERAILAIFERQTFQEQRVEQTLEFNKIGFNGPDARKMTYYANWIRRGNHLDGEFLEDAKKRILKYSKQLEKISEKKI